jgi:hypothetical protein
MVSIISLILFLSTVVFLWLFLKQKSKYTQIYERFKDVVDKETELENIRKQLEEVKTEYNTKRPLYDKFLHELSIVEETLEFTSYGVYNPHFDFDTSEEYKEKLMNIKQQQKQLLRNKTAAFCSTEWEVSGSKAKGRKMTNENIKLMLRAFNNESDAAIISTKWNNIEKMETRIKKAFEAINKTGATNHISIRNEYLKLKLDELYLTHEYKEKLYEEKEEQKRIKEEMREEERARRELEKARKDAEKEESEYLKALEIARSETEQAKGEEIGALNDKVAELERLLKEAHENKERALSRAQQTRSGHVYVISNIGSFGEDIYKIGMTRRLEPMDRVKELGDASVPFTFDVHAMIYSENAPALEAGLHQQFNDRRLNAVNNRKEFFNVTLNEIEKAVHELHGHIEFTKVAEAKEYRESVAMKEAMYLELSEEMKESDFPPTL